MNDLVNIVRDLSIGDSLIHKSSAAPASSSCAKFVCPILNNQFVSECEMPSSDAIENSSK